MTEAEWLGSDSPERLLGWWCPDDPRPDEDAPRVHRLRLIACGCCRRIWPLLHHERSRRAVEVAERFARGRATLEDLACAAVEAEVVAEEEIEESSAPRSGLWPQLRAAVAKAAAGTAANDETLYDLWGVPRAARAAAVLRERQRKRVTGQEAVRAFRAQERAAQAAIVRDVVGNPFRPVVVESHWRTATVLAIARGIDEDRAFEQLPILADALEDAGCEDEQYLDHCRGLGPHVRGCWAIDLLLGSE